MNHSHNYFEINTSTGCTSFTSTPAISPANYSFGSLECSVEEKELPGIEKKAYFACQQGFTKLLVFGFMLELLLSLVVKYIYHKYTKLFLTFFLLLNKGFLYSVTKIIKIYFFLNVIFWIYQTLFYRNTMNLGIVVFEITTIQVDIYCHHCVASILEYEFQIGKI